MQRKGNLKYKQNLKYKVSGSTKDQRKGKVESEEMKYAGVSGATLKKKNGRKESDEKEEGMLRLRKRNAFGKADTRRDAARKFYCRYLRSFHLQTRNSPFLTCELRWGRDGEKRRRETSQTSREKYMRKHAHASHIGRCHRNCWMYPLNCKFNCALLVLPDIF